MAKKNKSFANWLDNNPWVRAGGVFVVGFGMGMAVQSYLQDYTASQAETVSVSALVQRESECRQTLSNNSKAFEDCSVALENIRRSR